MANSVDPTTLAQFCAITDMDPGVGTALLTDYNGDLQAAVDAALGESMPQPQTQPQRRTRKRARGGDATILDEDAELRAPAGGGGPGAGGAEDAVRTPIKRRKMALYDDIERTAESHGRGGLVAPSHSVASEIVPFSDFSSRGRGRRSRSRRVQTGGQAQARQAVINALDPTGEAQSGLAKMFQPPFELMTVGPLDEVKAIAEQSSKYVLVNIQDLQVFESMVLNRDIWSNPGIADTVASSFVFWQVSVRSEDGAAFSALYSVTAAPYLAILEPQTGAILQAWDTAPSAETFLADILRFLATNKVGNAASSTSSTVNPIINATEEEQLNAAIRASMRAADNPAIDVAASDSDSDIEIVVSIESSDDDDDDDDDHNDGDDDPAPASVASTDASTEPAPQPAEELAPEPAPGPDTTRIKFIFPDNASAVRRFALDDPVSALFAFVRATKPDTPPSVDLTAPAHPSLAPAKTSTLRDQSLSNVVLRVVIPTSSSAS